MSDSTPNGYDPRWVEAINGALKDRGLEIRCTDLDFLLWKKYIGPMIDEFENGNVATNFYEGELP
jgi:hypothetical protein